MRSEVVRDNRQYRFEVIHLNENATEYLLTSKQPFVNTLCSLLAMIPLSIIMYQILAHSTIQLSWMFSLSLLPFVLKCIFRMFEIRAESVTAISDVGVQLTRYSYGSGTRRTFRDRDSIHTIIINEGFRLNKVIYYLGFLQRDSKSLLLPFEHIFPRLEDIYVIYKGVYGTLHGFTAEDTSESMRSPSFVQ
eukprot:ANDGO_02045.mRNA.1 hypothetical protein SAMD00019534_116650